jgi:hypothetical protein
MYVNYIAFIITVSKHIHFGAVVPLQNRKTDSLKEAMKMIFSIYNGRGFKIEHIAVSKHILFGAVVPL